MVISLSVILFLLSEVFYLGLDPMPDEARYWGYVLIVLSSFVPISSFK